MIALRKFEESRPEVFLGKDVLKICRRFTGVNPGQSVISIMLLDIFRILFLKNTSGWLLLNLNNVCPHFIKGLN